MRVRRWSRDAATLLNSSWVTISSWTEVDPSGIGPRYVRLRSILSTVRGIQPRGSSGWAWEALLRLCAIWAGSSPFAAGLKASLALGCRRRSELMLRSSSATEAGMLSWKLRPRSLPFRARPRRQVRRAEEEACARCWDDNPVAS